MMYILNECGEGKKTVNAIEYTCNSFGADVTLMEARHYLSRDFRMPSNPKSVYHLFTKIYEMGAMDMFVKTLEHYADNHNVMMADETYNLSEYLKDGNHVTVHVGDADYVPRCPRERNGYRYVIRVTIYR